MERRILRFFLDLLFPKPKRKPSRYIPNDVKAYAMRAYGGMCAYCGATEDLHFDHIIPYSRGGNSSRENIQVLCGYHNRLKSNKY